jgi:secondary thiamine-phosphate synthase enzyme
LIIKYPGGVVVMRFEAFTVRLDSNEKCRNITDKIKDIVSKWGEVSGLLLIFVKHTTCAVSINEKESGLIEDFSDAISGIVPTSGEKYYRHDDLEVRTENLDSGRKERVNGHAHIKAMLIGPSQVLPVIYGKIDLGKWQQILFFDFDDLAERQVRTITVSLLQ